MAVLLLDRAIRKSPNCPNWDRESEHDGPELRSGFCSSRTEMYRDQTGAWTFAVCRKSGNVPVVEVLGS
jgi:hypothetical protein